MPPAKTPAPSSNTPKSPGPRQRDAIILVLFAALWLACSVIPSYPYIFPEGKRPRLAGPDAYFHLRHTEAVLAHYPIIERHDLLTNFPDGEVGLNQSFFDVAMATIVKLTGLAPVIVLAWLSPVSAVDGVEQQSADVGSCLRLDPARAATDRRLAGKTYCQAKSRGELAYLRARALGNQTAPNPADRSR